MAMCTLILRHVSMNISVRDPIVIAITDMRSACIVIRARNIMVVRTVDYGYSGYGCDYVRVP